MIQLFVLEPVVGLYKEVTPGKLQEGISSAASNLSESSAASNLSEPIKVTVRHKSVTVPRFQGRCEFADNPDDDKLETTK